MSLFTYTPIPHPYVVQNKNNVLILTSSVPSQIHDIYYVFDGEFEYDTNADAFKLDSKRGYVAWYKEVSGIPKTPLKVSILASKSNMRSGYVKIDAMRQVLGFYFWLEKDGEIIDPLPYLQKQDKINLKEVKKPKNKSKKKNVQKKNNKKEEKEEQEVSISDYETVLTEDIFE